MTVAVTVVVSMIPQSVRCRDPTQQPPHLAVSLNTQNKMPVIRHQAERKQFREVFLQTLVEDANKGIVVLRFLKDGLTIISTVQCMINDARFVGSLLSGHGLLREYRPVEMIILACFSSKSAPVTFLRRRSSPGLPRGASDTSDTSENPVIRRGQRHSTPSPLIGRRLSSECIQEWTNSFV